MAYKILSSQLISSAILFISSIILIRTLSKDDYGLYVLIIAFFAFFDLLLGGTDASLVRFIQSSGKSMQHKLIAAVFSIKTIIVSMILIALYLLYDTSINMLNINNDKLHIYYLMYIIISISFLFKYIATTISTIINAYMLYDLMFKLSVLSSIVTLFISSSIYFWKLEIWQYVLLTTMWSFCYTVLLVIVFYKQKLISFKYIKKYINLTDIQYIVKDKILSYSLPLFGVGILSYIKNYLPTYIFGTMISLESLAVYSIFKKLTDFLHKGYASFIQRLYPKLFKMIDSKSKAIDKLFWIGLILRIFIFIGMYFSYDFILNIYNITEGEYDKFIFITLLSVYLLMYFATYSHIIIMSTKNTLGIFISSFLRNIPSLFLMYYLFNYYGLIGLLFSIYINAYLGTSYIIYLAYKISNKSYLLYIYYLILFFSSILLYNYSSI